METEKPAEPQLSPSSAPRSHGVSVLTSSARDIRASAADRSNGSPEKQLHSVPSPAELSHRTPAETPGSLPEQSMQVSVGQMEWKKQNPISSALVYTSDGSHPRTIPMTQPTVKDIRRTAVSPHEKAAGNLRAPSGGVTAPNTSSVEAAKAEQNRTPTQIPVPTDLILAQSGAFPLEPAAPMSRSETHVGGQDAQVVSPPEPTTLTYGPAQRQTEAGSPASATAEQAKPGESPFVRSLPDWARRFLASGTDSGSATQTMGVARSITSLPQPEPEESIQWSAPNFRPPEAQIAYRQKEKGETAQETTEVRISDADLQRAADRVYHMIEDRIRRERRRLGL